MRVFVAVLMMVMLALSWDTVAQGSRWQSGLVASAAGYGAAARSETRGMFRRAGL